MTDHPIAHPFASGSSTASHLARRLPSAVGETNDGAHTGTTPRTEPATPRAIRNRTDPQQIKRGLSERDLRILGSVAIHGFMTSRHITEFCFTDHASPSSSARAARRVLERLRGQRILGVLERRIGGVRSGSSGLVYYVDVVGDRVLRLDDPTRPRRRYYEPTTRFLEHTLEIVDVHLSAEIASRNAEFELVEVGIEKQSWRRYTGTGGVLTVLKPDLAMVTASGDYEDYWWIEVDRGQESLRTILRKCHEYEQYRRSGHEQARTGVFPQVIWIMTSSDPVKSARRRAALTEDIQRDHGLDADLYRIIGLADLVATIKNGAAS